MATMSFLRAYLNSFFSPPPSTPSKTITASLLDTAGAITILTLDDPLRPTQIADAFYPQIVHESNLQVMHLRNGFAVWFDSSATPPPNAHLYKHLGCKRSLKFNGNVIITRWDSTSDTYSSFTLAPKPLRRSSRLAEKERNMYNTK